MAEKTIRWVEEEVVEDLSLTYGWFYASLRKNPGKWAIHPGHYNTALRYGDVHEDFDARTATVDGVRVGLLRHNGERYEDLDNDRRDRQRRLHGESGNGSGSPA